MWLGLLIYELEIFKRNIPIQPNFTCIYRLPHSCCITYIPGKKNLKDGAISIPCFQIDIFPRMCAISQNHLKDDDDEDKLFHLYSVSKFTVLQAASPLQSEVHVLH